VLHVGDLEAGARGGGGGRKPRGGGAQSAGVLRPVVEEGAAAETARRSAMGSAFAEHLAAAGPRSPPGSSAFSHSPGSSGRRETLKGALQARRVAARPATAAGRIVFAKSTRKRARPSTAQTTASGSAARVAQILKKGNPHPVSLTLTGGDLSFEAYTDGKALDRDRFQRVTLSSLRKSLSRPLLALPGSALLTPTPTAL